MVRDPLPGKPFPPALFVSAYSYYLSGALIARIFFQPIEETSRMFFSKTLSSTSSGSLDPVALHNALTRLASLLLIYSHFSLFLLSLAPPYLKLVLSVVLPPR